LRSRSPAAEFGHDGATVRTLRSFIEACRELMAVDRDSAPPPSRASGGDPSNRMFPGRPKSRSAPWAVRRLVGIAARPKIFIVARAWRKTGVPCFAGRSGGDAA
jgi:hypothetical protein